jgi:hypothetical protein
VKTWKHAFPVRTLLKMHGKERKESIADSCRVGASAASMLNVSSMPGAFASAMPLDHSVVSIAALVIGTTVEWITSHQSGRNVGVCTGSGKQQC